MSQASLITVELNHIKDLTKASKNHITDGGTPINCHGLINGVD